jgi:hypothetical protein
MRGEVGDGDVAKPGKSLAGLLPKPPTGSWHRLPRHTLQLMDEAMEHVDEDCSAALRSAPTYDQSCSAADAADAADEAVADAAAPLGAPQSTTSLNKKLNKAAALSIFLAKRCKKGRRSSLSAALGRRYGTTPKAVRDVWNGRTWAKVTEPLWTAEERKAFEVRKMQFDHPAPNPTSSAFAGHLPCTQALWWPRFHRD